MITLLSNSWFSLPADDGEGSMDAPERQNPAFQHKAAAGSCGGNQGAAAALRARLNGTPAEATEGVVSLNDSSHNVQLFHLCQQYLGVKLSGRCCRADAIWQMNFAKDSLSDQGYVIATVMELLLKAVLNREPILKEGWLPNSANSKLVV